MAEKKSFFEKALLTWGPMIGTIFMVYSYIPQLMLTYSTQNISGQSFQFWFVLTISLWTMVGQQLGMIMYKGNKSYMGVAFQLINAVLATAMLVAMFIF